MFWPMIIFKNSIEDVRVEQLEGFFVGWRSHPTPETHLRLLEQSDYVVLAVDDEREGRVVGFITAISDKVLSAYIPFLEVLPEYQYKGIGRELLKIMLEQLKDYYMVDLVADPNRVSFYEQFGMGQATAMVLRQYDRQTGQKEEGLF
jgi:ribosomal protein S18 acetylase RimI-like enzyme